MNVEDSFSSVDLVRHCYNKNDTILSQGHTMRIDLSDKPSERDDVTFEAGNFPYLRLALLDLHLENEVQGSSASSESRIEKLICNDNNVLFILA